MRFFIVFLLFTNICYAQQPPAIGNFVYIDQIGNNNNIVVYQEDSDQKRANIVSNGDNNDYSIFQRGTGNHTALISSFNSAISNSNNMSNITQEGAGNHTANILSNGSAGSNTASITQKGGAGADKQFTLQLQGNGIGVKVTQDNPTTPDSSSMNIQCLTPPCNGYSYTKH
jgi:hypothetical protein